ncbi:MAG: hypothetical protein CMK59_05585 [Proteobacteria bacterium]|nr:hypothetical protein [Pseudomonadota bacterium]
MINSCGHIVEESWNRCPECGALVELAPEDPEALRRITDLIEGFLDDGILEDWEKKILDRKAREWGIRASTVKTLLDAQSFGKDVLLDVAYDEHSTQSFAVGHNCLIRLQIQNTSDTAFKSLGVHYLINPINQLRSESIGRIPPRENKQFGLNFIPTNAGHFTLKAFLEGSDYEGDVHRYSIEDIPLHIDAHKEGPSNIHLNVDAGVRVDSEKYGNQVKGGNINIDALSGLGPKSGALKDLKLHSLKVKPISENDFLNFKQRYTSSPTAGQLLKARIQTGLGTVPKRKTLTLKLGNLEWVITQGKQLTLGRQGQDQNLLVEPYLPQPQYATNLALCKKISSRHAQIEIKGNGAAVTDRNSGNGTYLDGTILPRGTTAPLGNGMELRFANSLTTRIELLSTQGIIDAVILERVNNMPHKKHILLNTKIGLWNNTAEILGSAIGAPVTIEAVNGWICIVNRSHKVLDLGNHRLEPSEALPLQADTGGFLLSKGFEVS